MENRKNSKIALAIVTGVAAGAAAWYFLNTENGRQNWANMVDAVKELGDKLISNGTEKASALASAGKDAAGMLANKANGLLEDAKKYS